MFRIKEISYSYYPFGMRQSAMSYLSGSSEQRNFHLYKGKELQTDFDINWYDYGARFYAPQLGRFHTQDRFAEKYSSLTTCQYGAENPILMIDINGDSISVAEKYKNKFNKALESVFGEKASNFSYTKNGDLVYNGSKRDFKGNTKKVFKKMSQVMGEETTTNVIYESTYTINYIDHSSEIVNTRSKGGGLTLLAGESHELLTENYIIIDTSQNGNIPVEEIGSGYTKAMQGIPRGTPGNMPSTRTFLSRITNVYSNPNNIIFYETGHVIYQGQSQDNVINFDNLARGLYKSTKITPARGYDKGAPSTRSFNNSPMKPRPFDINHNKFN